MRPVSILQRWVYWHQVETADDHGCNHKCSRKTLLLHRTGGPFGDWTDVRFSLRSAQSLNTSGNYEKGVCKAIGSWPVAMEWSRIELE
jgi:hypothetical protein